MHALLERSRCAFGTYVGTAEKCAALAGIDLLIFAFFSLWGWLSVWFCFSQYEKAVKPHAIAIQHIKHSRQFAFA
jgi:hypothetical protein